MLFTWKLVFSTPDGRLHLTLLDAGQGDALLVRTPAGKYILLNGGGSLSPLLDALGRRLPLIDPRLEALVMLVGNSGDQAAAARLMERFQPRLLITVGGSVSGLTAPGVQVHPARPGQELDLGDGSC